jgi:hypothetical protein
MKACSYVYGMVSALSALTVLALLATPCYGTDVTEILYDPDGFIYDVTTGAGTCIMDGTLDCYDNAYFLRINGVNYNATNLSITGRNIYHRYHRDTKRITSHPQTVRACVKGWTIG